MCKDRLNLFPMALSPIWKGVHDNPEGVHGNPRGVHMYHDSNNIRSKWKRRPCGLYIKRFIRDFPIRIIKRFYRRFCKLNLNLLLRRAYLRVTYFHFCPGLSIETVAYTGVSSLFL